MAADYLDKNELSDDDDEDCNVILMPPTEIQFAESNQDSGAVSEGGPAHLPRRVISSSTELSSKSVDPKATSKPLPTGPKPKKKTYRKKRKFRQFCSSKKKLRQKD